MTPSPSREQAGNPRREPIRHLPEPPAPTTWEARKLGTLTDLHRLGTHQRRTTGSRLEDWPAPGGLAHTRTTVSRRDDWLTLTVAGSRPKLAHAGESDWLTDGTAGPGLMWPNTA
ncbi:hypothetical protein GCM10010341_50670 [Streptomyces noursei]|nr:hypothetical protein GCM10010341_50670 [Streptomyces noursei]